MKLNVISNILLELYYNGVIRSVKKMEEEDFAELSKAAKGAVVRQYYYEEKRAGTHFDFISANSQAIEAKVEKDKRNRYVVQLDFEKNKIMRLPNGAGILRITPIDPNGEINYSSGFTQIPGGSEWLYADKKKLNDTGDKVYVFILEQIRLHASEDDMPNEVEVLAMVNNDEADISEDIAWDIINHVLVVLLKVIAVPVDQTDNSNPTAEIIRSKLAEAQAA